MTGVPVRSTKFASWMDEDAWMETMKGPKWKKVLDEEESLVESYTKLPSVKKNISKYIEYYKNLQTKPSIPFRHNLVEIEWISTFFKTWSFIGSKDIHECRDILLTPNAVYCTVDIKDGEEYFELQCWTDPYAKEPAWKMSPVGPEISCVNNTLYYLGVKHKLMYYQLWSCGMDGKNKKCIYTEPSAEVNLAIQRLADGKTIVSRENSQEFSYFDIAMKPSYKYTAPKGDYGIDWEWARYGFRITKEHNQKTFWLRSKKLLSIPAGEILVDPFAVWAGQLPCLVHVSEPVGISYYILHEHSIELIQKTKSHLQSKRVWAVSKDGTNVYGIITYKNNKPPKHLLAIGYGSYGMPSTTGPVLTRWGPLVEDGWAILYTFLRGGGDHTDAWAKAGRIGGREKTIEDFTSLILDCQKEYSISPRNTMIYGRSAGGLLMGGTLAKHPNGSLMSGVYAEVPYVDELRTTTNPELPLTTLEHNEFGNPSNRLQDFVDVALLSPADTASVVFTPSVFVLARTAENDSQVFTYESVKWIRRLRTHGGLKLCIIEKGQGHFTPPELQHTQWATDCALLNAWIHQELR